MVSGRRSRSLRESRSVSDLQCKGISEVALLSSDNLESGNMPQVYMDRGLHERLMIRPSSSTVSAICIAASSSHPLFTNKIFIVSSLS